MIVVLAANIVFHTATDSKHVNIGPSHRAIVVLDGAGDLGGIGPGEYKAVSYTLTNNSTSPAYVFVKVEEATAGLYGFEDMEGWVELTDAEEPGTLVYAYGTAGAMTPVGVGDSVNFTGRVHCLSSAVEYSTLTDSDMDIDVFGCLVYGTGGEYSKSAGSLWQAYSENK